MFKEQCIDTIDSTEPYFHDRITWKTWLKSGVRLFADDFLKLVDVPVTWQRRARDRHHLSHMTDGMLKDIGIVRAQANVESSKPFWRA